MTKLTSILLQLVTLHNLPHLAQGKKSNTITTANADSFTIESNTLSRFNVLDNDDGSSLYIRQVTEPQHGYLAILDGNLELLYDPHTDFVGVDSFNYTACDSSDSCASAKVEIRVGSGGSNNAEEGPVPNVLLAETNERTNFNVLDYNHPVVQLGDEIFVKKASEPQHGTVMVLSGGQKMIYSPDNGYEGDDSFTLAVCNASNECSTIDIHVKVGTNLFRCNTSTQNTVNIGYYQSWAIYRNSACNPMYPKDIQVQEFGYTHLVFSFGGISRDGKMEPYNGNTEFIAMYQDFNNLKLRYPKLKTLIAVGGWSFEQSIFSEVAASVKKREYFAKTVVEFLKTYGFDGIDLDWEYPVTRQGTPADYQNYPLLCEALRKAFNDAGHKDWVISVATAVNPDKIKKGFNMLEMAPHIDWFNMMSYDIYGSWDSHAGANTDMQYITNTMNYIYELGVPREKLVLGMAAYGRSMSLKDQNCKENGCEVTGAGLTGCHGEMGNLPYFQIDEMVKSGDYDSLTFNANTGSMEMVSGNSWTSYDSEETLNIKYRYAYDQCLRGIMWWAVDLLKKPIELYESQPSASPSISTAPTPFTKSPTLKPTRFPTSPPTKTRPCGLSCPDGAMGLMPMFDCVGYYSCETGIPSKVTPCPPGTIFDEGLQTCNWPWATSCSCTEDTKEEESVPSSSKTSRPSPIPEKVCNKDTTLTVNFGYYESWASGRWCNSVQPGAIDVDAFGYTHLAFSFAGISWEGELEPYDGDANFIPMFKSFNSLKKKNPELKTLIAVGGWTFPQKKFVSVSSTETKRVKFAKSVVRFLTTYGFDGIDLDWEYPVTRQGTPADYDNYPLLCEAIRNAFKEAGHDDWLITVATSINPQNLQRGYDMVGMAPHIDWFNMMAYDIYGSWDSRAGANADMQYITNSMHYIFGLGVPREKLVLGLAGYGRSMLLSDSSCTTDGCPVEGAGLSGCHGEGGNLPYFQIDEEFIQTGDYDSLLLNETTGSMELVTGGNRFFTSYDSPQTLGIKYRYAFRECLRGIMWWAVDLIKEPIDLLGEYKPSVSPSVSMAPSTETRHPTTSPTVAPTIRCGSGCPPGANGFFPTMDCLGYFECKDGLLSSSVIMCHGGLVFNEKEQRCDWDYNAQCQCTSKMFPPTTARPTNKPISAKPTKKPVTNNPSAKGSDQMEQQSSPTSSAPKDDVSKYYPDYDQSTCRHVDIDGKAPEFETNFFPTFEKCCEFPWIDTEKCLASKQINSKRWYPSEYELRCKNDGNPPPNVALSKSYNICCDRFMPSNAAQCYLGSKAFAESGGTTNMQQNSFPSGSGVATQPEKKDYYPDYDNSVCKNDGHAPEFETNFFSSYDACCEFAWIDTEKCLASKQPISKWYPASDGSCSNTGVPPKNIKLSESLLECCNRFFPYSDCIYRSNHQGSQSMTSDKSDCQTLNKKRCKLDDSCTWNETDDTCSETIMFSCGSFSNRSQCKREQSCSWNDNTGACESISANGTPSSEPTSKPTNQAILSSVAQTSCSSFSKKKQCKQDESCAWNDEESLCEEQDAIVSSCSSFLKKKQCKQDESCAWNDQESLCEEQDAIMIPNLAVALCSAGKCLDFKGQCMTEYNCLVDPCTTKSCKSNEICESSYCGGCLARCVENTMVQQSSSITKSPTSKPTSKPTARPSSKPVPAITKSPTSKPTMRPSTRPSYKPISDSNLGPTKVESVLEASKTAIDNSILLYQAPSNEWEPSSVYRYNDFIAALRVMFEDRVAGKHFYMGDDSPNGHKYGLVNIAAFLAQSMKETIRYNACDENSWDLVNGVYPLSNACGQLGQSYQDYKCSAAEAHMQCEVDTSMKITATTNSKWWGAPAPLFCAPRAEIPFTGYWDYTEICHDPWASPPKYCTDYKDQKAGGFNNDHPVANSAGRTDVEGCCFWGRGVIQTTGVCNFGKLNWYLGARAAREGRPSRYPDIDFCKTPDAICSSQEHKELKWIAGMFYWVESLQSYNSGGWDYITELKKWVDSGMSGNSFIDSVSGIVNRGCHSPPCASGAVDGQFERAANFIKVLKAFGIHK